MPPRTPPTMVPVLFGFAAEDDPGAAGVECVGELFIDDPGAAGLECVGELFIDDAEVTEAEDVVAAIVVIGIASRWSVFAVAPHARYV